MQKITLSANEPIDFRETNNVKGNLEIILVWTFLPAFQFLNLAKLSIIFFFALPSLRYSLFFVIFSTELLVSETT